MHQLRDFQEKGGNEILKIFKLLYALYRMRLLSPLGLYRLIAAIYKYGINIMALLYFAKNTYADKIALVDENETISYKQLLSQSEKLAAVFKENYHFCCFFIGSRYIFAQC